MLEHVLPDRRTVAWGAPVFRSHASRKSAAAMPAPFPNDPATYSVDPITCRAWTDAVIADPVPGALQGGFQLVPSQTARKSAFGSPPALVNCPPT